MELLASTVRMRPEITSADIARVGLVRGTQEQYPGQWMLILIWDHRGQAVFFGRKDFESLIVVDEPISSRSPDSR